MLTVSNTAVDLSTAISTSASIAYVVPVEVDAADLFVQANSIRWLDDGNTPTDAIGHLASSTGITVISLRGLQVRNFKMIRATGSDATVSVRIGKTN